MDRGATIAVLLLVFFSLPILLSSASAQEGGKFQYDVFCTFWTSEGWEIVAQEGQQIAQKFHVRIYVSRPCRVDVDIVVGGESEFQMSEQVDFRWERTHTTQKSQQPLAIYLTFCFDETVIEATWRGQIVKAPMPIPRDIEEWLSPRQVERLIEGLNFQNIIKAIVFALVGVGLAIVSRYYFLLLSPLNSVHVSMLVTSLMGCLLYDSQWGIGYWLVILLSDFVVYQFIKSARLMSILVYDLPNRNFDLIGLPHYTNPAGKICAALQSSVFALKRTLLNRHVEFRFRNEFLPEEKQAKILTMKPTHTLNKAEPLYLADKAGVTELVERIEEEEAGGGIIGLVRGMTRREKEYKKLYFDIWPSECGGIPFDNFTLGFEMDAIKKLKQWAVDLATENAELKQRLEAESIRKGQEIAKRHLDEIFRVVGLSGKEASVGKTE